MSFTSSQRFRKLSECPPTPDGVLEAPLGTLAFRTIVECKTAQPGGTVNAPRLKEPAKFRDAYKACGMTTSMPRLSSASCATTVLTRVSTSRPAAFATRPPIPHVRRTWSSPASVCALRSATRSRPPTGAPRRSNDAGKLEITSSEAMERTPQSRSHRTTLGPYRTPAHCTRLQCLRAGDSSGRLRGHDQVPRIRQTRRQARLACAGTSAWRSRLSPRVRGAQLRRTSLPCSRYGLGRRCRFLV